MQSQTVKRPHVLFLGHEASRSGAPLILLHYLQWLRQNSDLSFSIALWNGGPLEADFRRLAPTVNLGSWPWAGIRRRRAITSRIGIAQMADALNRFRCRSVISPKPDLIYANSIASLDAVSLLGPVSAPLICHVHELDYAFERTLSDRAAKAMSRVDHFVACSEAVRKFLIDRRHVSPDRVTTIYEFIPAAPKRANAEVRQSTREALNVPQDALVIGGSGSPSWRKGSDLFVQMAHHLTAMISNRPVHFVWVGFDAGVEAGQQMQREVERLKLQSVFHLVPHVKNPLDYYASFDLFALTSREDPFPLVCLEAASMGIPTVCFEGAGGMPEFVAPDCGEVARHLDVQHLAELSAQLLADAPRLKDAGTKARAKVERGHLVSKVAPQIFALMSESLSKKHGTCAALPGDGSARPLQAAL